MFEGVAAVRFQGDRKKALGRIRDAQKLLIRLDDTAKRMGVTTFAIHERFEGGYIHAMKYGGQNYMFIAIDPVEVVDEPLEFPLLDIPGGYSFGIYSGVVVGGVVEPVVTVNEDGTETRVEVLNRFHPAPVCIAADKLKPGSQRPEKLAIAPWVAFDEAMGDAPGGGYLSQHARLKPSMYSGLMQKAVQAVFSLGKLPPQAMPQNTGEEKHYANDVASNGVQLRFDYRFHRTHGIVKKENGDLWLLEISVVNGVIARPLPLFGSTLNTSHAEVELVLDELGGFPTGMAFPAGTATKDAIARGDFLQLLSPGDMNTFYKNAAWSSASGWAFGARVPEAHNICYYFNEEDGVIRSCHYVVKIQISNINRDRKDGAPIGTGYAALQLMKEGKVWQPPGSKRPQGHKMWEPVLGHLISADYHAAFGSGRHKQPFCDTPVHVFMLNDRPHITSYHRNPEAMEGEEIVVDTRPYPDECKFASGGWEYTTYTGYRGKAVGFYCTTHDYLDFEYDTMSTSQIEYQLREFTGIGFGDYPQALNFSHIGRSRRVDTYSYHENDSGMSRGSYAVVPVYAREAVYLVSASARYGYWWHSAEGDEYITDPNYGVAYRNFYGWVFKPPNVPPRPSGIVHAPPEPPPGSPCESATENWDRCGTLHPDRRVVVLCRFDDDDPCYPLADQGQVIELCQTIGPSGNPDGGNMGPPGGGQPPPERNTRATGGDPETVYEVIAWLIANHSEGAKPIKLDIPWQSVFDFGPWSLPADDQNPQWLGCTWSALGNSCIVYDPDFDKAVKIDGYYPYNEIGRSPTFIGVNA